MLPFAVSTDTEENPSMSPKIDEPTIIEQRAMRQRQLIDAAMSLALEGGAPSVTVAAVAKRAGISRTLVYEYFSSSADLIADLVMEELDYYCNRLAVAVKEENDPERYLELWIEEALSYVADGRHMLVKSLNSVATPEYRRGDIGIAHKKLMSTIILPLEKMGLSNIQIAISLLQSTIDNASVRIDGGNEAALEIQCAQKYAIAGLRALATN